MMELKYYDISPQLSEDIAVFPGTQKLIKKITADFKNGDHLRLSEFCTTVHIGAHADAPSHYHKDGESIEQRDLNFYFGPCQVISASVPPRKRIYSQDILKNEIKHPRVLLRTNSFVNPHLWREDFNSLSPELIDYLYKKNVKLIGIDTPSIDPADSKKMESHQQIYKYNMAVLEGLWLHSVPDGEYFLSALPLPLKGLDAAPVRAVLFDLNFNFFRNHK